MFGPSQIAQAGSFRDQALIAIENARQFNETQEALERQKASAEVLGAISKSVADTTPVFETILDACRRLLGSDETGIYAIGDDNMVRVAAWRGPRAEEVRHDVTPAGESVTGRIIRERRVHHIPDLRAEANLSPAVRDRVDRLGSASLLYAPMLWEDRGLGSILVVRSPPRPFSEREHALLQSFADQAAIAIQNARLFRETQEALQQQTATADVLKVISRSAFDLKIGHVDRFWKRQPNSAGRCSRCFTCETARFAARHEIWSARDVRAPGRARRPFRFATRCTRAGPRAPAKVAHFPDAWTDSDYFYKATAKRAVIARSS